MEGVAGHASRPLSLVEARDEVAELTVWACIGPAF